MDMNYQFLYCKQMGQMCVCFVGCCCGDDWVEVDYMFVWMEGKQLVGEVFVFGLSKKFGDQVNKSVMMVCIEYLYQMLWIWLSEGMFVMDLWIVYVLFDVEQCINCMFGLLLIYKFGILFVFDFVWLLFVWFIECIFCEDCWIVE